MRLSQGQLTVLEACERKFQHLFLDQIGALPDPQYQERLEWGSRFHLRMQQGELGLPTLLDPNESPPLEAWRQALIAAAPEVFQHPHIARESEHRRSLEMDDYLLTAVYDLLVLDRDRAYILDWKTYPKPISTAWLETHWQTRLYLFVLAETSTYPPDRIAMHYWFVKAGEGNTPQPQRVEFLYSYAKHEQTRRDLHRLLARLTQGLDRYEAGEDLKQVNEGSELCLSCPFAVRCQRGAYAPTEPPVTIPAVGDIEEIAL